MVIARILMKTVRDERSVTAVHASAVPQEHTLNFALGKQLAQFLL
jgi:hypothetical protein